MNRKRFLVAGALAMFGLTRGKLSEFAPPLEQLMPDGSFLFMDGGVLELGIIRDSTLNATNSFQVFGETFGNVAYTGSEKLSIISTSAVPAA